MNTKITTKKLASNVVLSVAAQAMAIVVSLIIHLVVPKFIDEAAYANWQVYVLYTGYVGVFHFGLLDGLILRYSQYDYENIDKARMRSQFLSLLVFTSVLSFVAAACSLAFMSEPNTYIFMFVGISIITKNAFTYNSYTFQITNRINKYVVLILLQKVIYGAIVLLLVILKVNDFRWYCVCDIIADVASFVIMSFFNKGMFLGKALPFKDTLIELRQNVGSGIMLMLANWSSILLVGSAKMFVQWGWDTIVFGKVSLAFSITNLFLTFVTAISVVLFPSLKRIDENSLAPVYNGIKGVLTPLLLLAMALYFPGCWLLEMWLPKYVQSLEILAFLLPIIVFSSKINLLINNYLKLFRKEKLMLIINIISVAVAATAFAIGAFWVKSLEMILISVVATLAITSIALDAVVSKKLEQKIGFEAIIEIIGSAIFVACATLFERWIGFAIYVGIVLIYVAFNAKKIIGLIKSKAKEKN